MSSQRSISLVNIVTDEDETVNSKSSIRCFTVKCLLIALIVIAICALAAILLAVFVPRKSKQEISQEQKELAIVSRAKFLLECRMPHDAWAAKNGKIHDVCWWDVTSLIAIQGRKLLNITINLQDKSCNTEVVDNSYLPHFLSCLPPQELYVTGSGHGIKVYNGGQVKIWRPPGIGWPGMIATNDNYFVSGEYGKPTLSVFNKTKDFLYEIKIPKGYFVYTHLTQDDLLLGTTWADFTSQLLLVNLTTNVTMVAKGGVKDGDVPSYSGGVCTTPDNKILVVDYGNRRVNAFSMEGVYLYQVLKWRKLYPGAISVIRQSDNSSVLAVSLVYPASKGAHLPHIIRFYSLQ